MSRFYHRTEPILKVILAVIVFLIFLPESSDIDAAEIVYDVEYNQFEARDMLSRINSFRTGNEAWYLNEDNSEKVWARDLDELVYDYELEKVAMKRAEELVVKFSHERPDGRSCDTACEDLGYYWVSAYGENIAFGQNSEASAFEAWKEDNAFYSGQGHRRNMLSNKYKAIGIACLRANDRYFWVQEFSGNSPEDTRTSAEESVKEVRMEIPDEWIKDFKISIERDYTKSLGGNGNDQGILLIDKNETIPFSELGIHLELPESYVLLKIKNEPSSIKADGKYVSVSDNMFKGKEKGTGSITVKIFGVTKTVEMMVREPGEADPRIPDSVTGWCSSSELCGNITKRIRYTKYKSSKEMIQIVYEEDTKTVEKSIFSAPIDNRPDIEVTGQLKYNAWYRVTGENEVKLVDLYSDYAEEIIPDTVSTSFRYGTNYNVSSIGSNAAFRCKIQSIKLGKNIRVIESKAFADQTKLKKIEINCANLKEIGKNAFKNIYKKAMFTLIGTKAEFNRVKKMIVASGVSSKVRFRHVKA